jgi:hypothetical protein
MGRNVYKPVDAIKKSRDTCFNFMFSLNRQFLVVETGA